MLRGALSAALAADAEAEEDPAKKAELDRIRRELQREAPRKSVAVTQDNMNDQSFHDARYYAELAAGRPHHLAWKNEKARRRAILERKKERCC